MKILYSYILKEHFFPFFMSLALILSLFVLNIIMKMMTAFVGKDLEILIIIEFFYLSMGWILALAVPMSVLVASLMAYGRLSQDNEWTVMQSGGISVYQALLPALLAGILLSVGMMYFHDNILPEMNHRNKVMRRAITRKKPLAVIEPGVFVSDIPGLVIRADKVNHQKNELYKVILLDNSRTGKYRRTITADTGRVVYDESSSRYIITLKEGEIANLDPQKPEGYFMSRFSKMEISKEVSGVDFEVQENAHVGDREKSTDSLKAKIERLKARRASPLLIAQVEVEYYKKFALSFACIVMVLVGAPLGLMSGKSGLGGSATMSILVFTVYWFFLVSGEDLAGRGKIDPLYAMWNANFFIGVLGMFLIYYASKGYKISFKWISVPLQRIFKIFGKRS